MRTAYGSCSSYDLEKRTHQEKPWQAARNGLPLPEPSEAVISMEEMKTFFKAELHEQEKETSHTRN